MTGGILMIRKSSAMRRLRVRLAALAVCAAMFPAASPAQSARATLTGNVYDSTGAAVVNAKVVVTATREGVSYNALTNSAGAYSVPELNPGLYSVRVEAGGFKTTEVSGLALEVGETARQNFTLN